MSETKTETVGNATVTTQVTAFGVHFHVSASKCFRCDKTICPGTTCTWKTEGIKCKDCVGALYAEGAKCAECEFGC